MLMYCRQVLVTLILLLTCASVYADNEAAGQPAQTPPAADSLHQITQSLIKANYREKAEIAEQMAAVGSDRSLIILKTFLDGNLYYRKDDNTILIVVDEDNIRDAFTDQPVEGLGRRDKRKIGVNNSLRGTLRSLISQAQINSKNVQLRLEAATNLLKNSEDVDVAFVEAALSKEDNKEIKRILSLVKGLILLQSDSAEARMAALTSFEGSLYPEIRAALIQFMRGFSEQEKASRAGEYKLAQATLDDIESMLRLNGYAENLYFGLALGAVLLLAAIGLAITFGVMGVINMAHGEMIMLGAYTTYVVQQLMPDHIGLSLVVSVPAAFLVSGAVGVAIERGVIRHLYGRPLETLLATFGISLILQQAVRSIFSPLNRQVASPDWMSGTFMLNPALELTWNRLYIIIFSLLVLAVLALVLKRTLFGLQMRAVTMNRPMASSMGIRTGWVDALTFGLGSGIAGIAGVALSQLTNVGPNLGQAYIIDSFMVVVFGGVGNLWGTLVAAMSLGVANKIIEPMAGAVLAKILVLVFIILFIQKRPRGLFALKGRAADNS
ncbi:MAG: urea ABC transporter permease subunit UrtB [Oceanospirillaceae bacterium]|nr:urea ABC transporter permease subunit UrtB [Oceanospirillaceae bacterium]MBT10645.1 urea ABC transporter permease subunit UrtB [Oceanospirillaceae bacterium]|tara:strand:- start:25341 stop:26996 length:1656 start_codon:yes stop_codon:yes gene_type:complete